MKRKPSTAPEARILRQRAEQMLRERQPSPPLTEANVRALVHELQVHQIELEMQNEELHRAQALAEEQAVKYRDLFDFAPIGYFHLAHDGEIREVNLAGAALLGLDRSRVAGRRFDGFVAPEYRPEFEEFGKRVGETETKQVCELKLIPSADGCRHVMVEGILADEGTYGSSVWMLAVMDITARKRAEEKLQQFNAELEQRVAGRTAELREANERYELVLAGAEAGIWDWDVPRHTVVFSARWKAMRGFAEDEVSDAETEWSRAIHPDDAPRVMAAVQAHFEGKTPVFAGEYRVRRKDGSWIWIADHGLARRDAHGNVLRMAGSETDITERKRAEEALRTKNAELARFNTAMINRELRMIEIKKEINLLLADAGKPKRYPLEFDKDAAAVPNLPHTPCPEKR